MMPLCAKIAQEVISSFYGHNFVRLWASFCAESSGSVFLGGTRPYEKLQPIFASFGTPQGADGDDLGKNCLWATHLWEHVTSCKNDL